MPLGPTLLATGSVTRDVAPQATGTVTVSETYPDATLSLNGAAIAPWLADDRWTRVEVLLDGERLAGLIGSVSFSESESSPVQEASFDVVDTRATWADPDSLVYGAKRVDIYVTARTATATTRIKMFQGNVESASNDDAYCPRASIRAASLSRVWADRGANTGLLYVPAFSGYTWGELIQLYAASTCTPLTVYKGELGDVTYSSFDVSGMSLADLIQQWAPLIGVYLRETDGTLELVPERFVVGPLASPAYAFDQSNYLSVREDPPSRPITAITLTATTPDLDALGAELYEPPVVETIRVLREDGTEEETVITTQWRPDWWGNGAGTGAVSVGGLEIPSGLTVQREVIQETFSADPIGGETESTKWGLRARVITREWFTAVSETIDYVTRKLATQQLLVSDREEWGYYSPLTYVGSGYLWADGSTHAGFTASWQRVSHERTVYTYDTRGDGTDPCMLIKSEYVKLAYGSALEPDGEVWDDGQRRVGWAMDAVPAPFAFDYEYYGERARQIETWTDTAAIEPRAAKHETSHTLTLWGWKQTGSETVDGVVLPLEQYVVTKRQSEYRAITNSDTFTEVTINDGVTVTRTVKGAMPEAQSSSAETPSLPEKAIVITGAALRTAYPTVRASETSQDAQRPEEMQRFIRRRLRDSLAVRYVIAHPMVAYLRVFDAVTLTDPTRQLDEAQGYVTSIRRTFDLSTGWCGQETEVAVTPPELDPVWP